MHKDLIADFVWAAERTAEKYLDRGYDPAGVLAELRDEA